MTFAEIERRAGTRDSLRKSPDGRKITTIEAIGRAIGWTLAETLGIEVKPPLYQDALRIAILIAIRATGDPRTAAKRAPVAAKIAISVYPPYAEMEAAGVPIPDDDVAVSMMDGIVARIMAEFGVG